MIETVFANKIYNNGDLSSKWVSFTLRDPSNGFVIQNIEGLGPVKAELSSSKFARLDGEQYHSSRLGTRNIVITVELKATGTATVQSLRNELYSVFIPKNVVALRFNSPAVPPTPDFVTDITGVVDSCEPVLFSKKSLMVISLTCHQPDFLDFYPSEYFGETTIGAEDYEIIDYPGTVDSGFLFELYVDQSINTAVRLRVYPSLNISGTHTQLVVTTPMLPGDVLTVDTRRGQRSAKLYSLATNTTISVLSAVTGSWPVFTNGENAFRAYCTKVDVPYRLSWLNRYGGL